MYKLFVENFLDFIILGLTPIILSPIVLILWIRLSIANKGTAIIHV